MRALRLALSALVVTALMALVTHARAAADSSGAAACTSANLSAALVGALPVTGVAAFGCEGGWAYLWANVGTGASEVSVTELFALDPLVGGWRVVDRGTYCVASRLPTAIYRRGCLSN